MNYPIEKPKLTDTGLGFSVFYKEKYLYSKRDPQKSILNLIENTEIMHFSRPRLWSKRTFTKNA